MVAMMGWGGSGAEQGWRKGPWTPEEDKLLSQYVNLHGEGRWSSVARGAGLNRSGKSCRLRWVNYLRPGLKRGQITPQEEGFIIELHALWGNKWSTIARYLPGRTDNEIKNFWRTHFKKKEKCTVKQEKRKGQLLKAKQQEQEQLQQEQLRLQEDRNKVVADDVAEARQENIDYSMYPAMENQVECLPVLMNQGSIESWSKIISEDVLFLDRLWNLDDHDVHYRMDQQHKTSLSQCNRSVMQNQGITTSSAGDSSTAMTWGGGQCSNNNVFYSGGYIF